MEGTTLRHTSPHASDCVAEVPYRSAQKLTITRLPCASQHDFNLKLRELWDVNAREVRKALTSVVRYAKTCHEISRCDHVGYAAIHCEIRPSRDDRGGTKRKFPASHIKKGTLMRRIRTGDTFHHGASEFLEGTHFNFTIGGRSLILSVRGPDSRHIREINNGDVVLGLALRAQVLFVLAKFGQLPWNVGHYNWWINPPIIRPDPITEAEALNDVRPMGVVLLDADSGIVKTVRTVHPPKEFRQRLLYEVEVQIRSRFNPWEYLEVVDESLKRSSGKEAIIRQAVCICSCNWPVGVNRQPLPMTRSVSIH